MAAINNRNAVFFIVAALVAVGVIAYMVYHQCKPTVHINHPRSAVVVSPAHQHHQPTAAHATEEGFIDLELAHKLNLVTRHTTEFDKTQDDVYSAATLTEAKKPYHIEESRVSFLEETGDVASVMYGVVKDDQKKNLPMFALKCIWNRKATHPGTPGSASVKAKLCVTVFVNYYVGKVPYILSKTFDVDLEVNNTHTSFIPINSDIINRKIAHSARIVRVCIERKDANPGSVLGLEKLCAVKYNASAGNPWNGELSAGNGTDLSSYEKDSGKRGVAQNESKSHMGQRLEMGVAMFDPVCLVSQKHHPTPEMPSTYLSKTTAVLADISYNLTTPTYGHVNTQSFRVRVSFSHVQAGKRMELYFARMKAGEAEEQALAKYIAGEPLPSFADTLTSNSTSNAQGEEATASSLTAAGSGPQSVLLSHHIGKAVLFDVEPNVVYEFSVALTEPLSQSYETDVFTFGDTNRGSIVHTMYFEPLNGTGSASECVSGNTLERLMLNTGVSSKYLTIKNMTKVNESNVCGDYVIDADSTIMRFDHHPSHPSSSLKECGLFAVNDGFLYSGSLLAPLRTGVANANHLFTLGLRFSTGRRILVKLLRDGLYIYEKTLFGTQPIATVPLDINSNDVHWYIYVHKGSIGVCVNNAVSFSTSDLLKEFYHHADSDMPDAYNMLKTAELVVDKAFTLQSRFISALARKPSRADMTRSRADIVNLLQVKPSLLYKSTADGEPGLYTPGMTGHMNGSTSADPEEARAIRSTGQGRASNQQLVTRAFGASLAHDSGISIQCELTKESIEKAIQTFGSRFYHKDPKIPQKEEEAVLFETNAVRVVLQKQKIRNPSPLMYNIAIYYTTECGSFSMYPTAIANYKLFYPNRRFVKPRVVIKYTSYEKVERVCVVRYDQNYYHARVHSSLEHQISKAAMRPLTSVSYNPVLADTFVCGARALSTNCNPFNTVKMCDCTGRISADPSVGITNLPCETAFSEAKASEANSSFIANPTHQHPASDLDACIRYAGKLYGMNGIASYDEDGAGRNSCMVAKYPAHIRIDENSNSKSYTFRNMCDQGMRLKHLME